MYFLTEDDELLEKHNTIWGKKIPKLDSNHTCFAVISLDSAFNKDSNYYPQVFIKECKYIEKNINHTWNYIKSN